MGQKSSLCSSSHSRASKKVLAKDFTDTLGEDSMKYNNTSRLNTDMNRVSTRTTSNWHSEKKSPKIIGNFGRKGTTKKGKTNKNGEKDHHISPDGAIFKAQTTFGTSDISRTESIGKFSPNSNFRSIVEDTPDKTQYPCDALLNQKAMKVRISWIYGGKEVYIIGSFTNWDYMIKLHKNMVNHTPIFEISMYLKEGMYYYHFVVDGVVRFAPEQPSSIERDDKIVNYIDIDKYMIQKAEEERDEIRKVKNMADCLATENSWKLSDNFAKNVIEKKRMNLEDHLDFTIDFIKTESHGESAAAGEDNSEYCDHCLHRFKAQKKQNTGDNRDRDPFKPMENQEVETRMRTVSGKLLIANKHHKQQQQNKTPCKRQHMKFCPSSSYVDKENILALQVNRSNSKLSPSKSIYN